MLASIAHFFGDQGPPLRFFAVLTPLRIGFVAARNWRDPLERLMPKRGECPMKLISGLQKLNWVVTAVALTMAVIALQSPLF